MADEIWKSVDIDGERYSVKKFTAVQGLQLVRFILAKFAPIIPVLQGEGDMLSEEAAEQLMAALSTINDDEVESLVMRCLKNCYKILPAGPQAVVDATGHYGIEGIEYDILKTCKLCVEAMKWGCSGFFGEKGSAFVAQQMGQLSSQQSPQTSTPSSLPQ